VKDMENHNRRCTLCVSMLLPFLMDIRKGNPNLAFEVMAPVVRKPNSAIHQIVIFSSFLKFHVGSFTATRYINHVFARYSGLYK
jgi:hypothetical protein